ncbi:MAG: hypothetical protein ACFFC7_23965, partial [Candidatus Hermodarchaeota archaeon]
MTGLKYDPPNFLKQGIIRLKEFYSSPREILKEWFQRDFIITILIFLAIFILELLLGTFYDTTTHWDAWTRAQNAMIYVNAPFIKWIPFIPYAVVGLVWLPGHFYVLASLHLLTGIPTLYLGEIISAIAAAGMICYLFLILRQYINLPQRRAIIVSLLPLTSGLWVSYGSQCMTDLFSLFLTVATLFHFGKFILSQDRNS